MKASTPCAPSPLMIAALALLTVAPLIASGCSAQCPQVRDDYRRALRGETDLSQEREEGDEPAQIGLSMKTDLINDIANTALQSALKAGLSTLTKVDVGGGQTVGIETRGDLVNMTVEASDACEHCFRIGGELDGGVDLDIPAVGTRSANLDGSLDLVAPLVFERTDDGAGALALDLTEAARLGKTSVDARLSNVRDSWARVLQNELSDHLVSELTDELEPVDIVTFKNPDFGIPGLEVYPVDLTSDARSGAVFAGFSTNIEALSDEEPIEPFTDLEEDQNLALSFNPNLVAHGVSLMMQKDTVSRTYSVDGRPLRGGPARATIRDFSFSKGRVGELPMTLGFQVFNLGNADDQPEETQMCYWFEGEASGRVALRGEDLEVSLTDVDIVDGSIPPAAIQATNWVQADFLQGGKRLVRASLDEENIAVPGGQLAFAGLAIELLDNQVVLAGASKVR